MAATDIAAATMAALGVRMAESVAAVASFVVARSVVVVVAPEAAGKV
jgi:hypothetical protein